MTYSFKSPEMLLLLLFVPLFILIVMKSKASIPLSKKIVTTMLRVLAFVLLVFAIAGFSKTITNDELYVIYLIDNSDSHSDASVRAALNHIYNASESMGRSDRAAVVVFGSEAVVELPFSGNIGSFKISSYVDKSHTNIAQAIKIAEILFPDDVQKRIVLFTDGNENEGNAIEEAKIAASQGIELITVIPEDEETEDYSIEKLITPKSVALNEPFEVRVVVTGNTDATATLTVRLDKGEILKRQVMIKKGKKSVVKFQESLTKKGAHIFDVRLTKKGDTHMENNRAEGFVLVSGEQTVLYVYDGERRSEDLISVLKASRLKVDTVTPELIKPSISFLSNYDTIILDNVPATRFSTHHMKSIQMYVKAFGGGLIMIGGDNSFGLGGYFRTPIERVLPVDMDIKQRKKYGSIAMVVVIDKSGSMSYSESGVQKIQLANEGAINVLELLFVNDMIGVIACDSVPKWAVNISKVDDKESVANAIASIRAGGGGIYTYSALAEAYDKLKDIKATLKHVILFADASDAEEKTGLNGEHTYALAQRMFEDKITVSTIAIGNPGDADLEFLEKTAFYGQGRFYFTSDMFTLPQIFAKEAFIASKSLVMEGEFKPIKKDELAALSNVDLTDMPPVKGYVITSPKELSIVPYETDHADPLLAMWQYGLGRSAAFTSDATSKWAVDWIGKDGYAEFWSQLVRWTLKKGDSSNYEVNLTKKGNKINISVDALDDQGEFLNFADLKATMVYPDFTTKDIALNQTGSGRYEASGEIKKSGTYFVNIARQEGDEIKERVNAGISLSYLDEYKEFGVDMEFLTHLTNVTDGRFLKDARDIFEHTRSPAVTYRTIITPLILLSIILFVLDAMVRKLTFKNEHLVNIKESIFTRGEVEAVDHGYEWLRHKGADKETTDEESLVIFDELPQGGTSDAPKTKTQTTTDDGDETTLKRLIKAKRKTFEKHDED